MQTHVFPELIDLILVRRILELTIEQTKKQIGKSIDQNDPVDAIFEIWRSQKLKPPFDDLYSRSQITDEILAPAKLFDYVDVNWTLDIIATTLSQLESYRLIQEIQLDEERYTESAKVYILPLGILFYDRISKMTNVKMVSGDDFYKWVTECHLEHSQYTLDALIKKVRMSVLRGKTLSPFNISLALFLLMYGAISRERALKINVDPTNHIIGSPEIMSRELTRIGERVVGRNPITKSTLLDHVQESNKIKNVLDDSNLYIRYDSELPSRGKQYSLYFNLGRDANQPKTLSNLNRVLRSIITIAENRRENAPKEIINLFQEHINSINIIMKPVHTKMFFGDTPSISYLMTLHEQAVSIVYSKEEADDIEGEGQEDDDNS